MRLPEGGRAAVAAAALALAAAACGGDPVPDSADREGLLDDVRYVAVTSREHTEADVAYPHVPPVGGDHLGIWQNCGFYSVEVLDEAAVHSLEHGVAWITYRPDLGTGRILELREALEGRQRTLVSPHGGQMATVVATAWGRRLEMDGVDRERLVAFLEAFTDAESAPEPGAACEGGLGVPPAAPMAVP